MDCNEVFYADRERGEIIQTDNRHSNYSSTVTCKIIMLYREMNKSDKTSEEKQNEPLPPNIS